MNSIKTTTTGNIVFAFIAAMMLFYFSSCSRKTSFQTSSVVPAAKGSVKVKKDNNSNYQIKISISNLADPKRLQPSKDTYVVWLQSDNNIIKNIGQINSSTGFLSKKLKASFQTVSAFNPNKIFITAENDAAIQFPGSMVVLSTNNF